MIRHLGVFVAAVHLVAFLSIGSTRAQKDKTSDRIISYGKCTTPDGESASCISLDRCTKLYNMLQRDMLTSDDRQFLTKSQCGYNNGKVLVCCSQQQTEDGKSPNDMTVRSIGSIPKPGKCGDADLTRIHNGNITKIDEYPWMALIEYMNGNSSVGFHCGGSLINDRYVLTAAHCITAIPEKWSAFRVRLGEWDTSTDPDCKVDTTGSKNCADPHIDVTIEKKIPHENYNASSNNKPHDIALIRLSRSVAYSDFIQPICLPTKDSLKNATFDGVVMDVCGWGSTEKGPTSDLKLKAGIPVVPLDDCKRVYKRTNVTLQGAQFCAGGKMGVDSCLGDSGGPLIGLDNSDKSRVYYFIAGIVSFGATPCGLPGWPGVYTKVSDYIGWIMDNIEP